MQLGLKVEGGRQELSETEKWADAGVNPATGSKVPVVEYDKLPITVRELIHQLKDRGPNAN
jgi:hypothetical protein